MAKSSEPRNGWSAWTDLAGGRSDDTVNVTSSTGVVASLRREQRNNAGAVSDPLLFFFKRLFSKPPIYKGYTFTCTLPVEHLSGNKLDLNSLFITK